MGIRLYDEAVARKIQSWIPADRNLHVLKPDETSRLFQIKNDEQLDQPLSLPCIALSRDTSITLNLRTKNVLSFDGVRIGQREKGTLHMDCIPIELTYHLDIYTRRYDEGDEYLRNFVFQIINRPKFYVEIPYNGYYIRHIAYMRLGSTVTDNSTVAEKLFPDEFTRWTLDIEIADAFLFSTPYSKNWAIEFDPNSLEIQDSLTPEEIAAIDEIAWKENLTNQQKQALMDQAIENHVTVESVLGDEEPSE